MEELRQLFGDGSISFDEFTKKLGETGIKLADLSKGEYIGKGKYDKLSSDFEKYKKDNDVSKYADYDQIKQECETLKQEKAENEMMSAIVSKGVSEKFRKFVLSEVKGKVTEDKKFDKALEEYLAENEEFVEGKNPFFVKGSSSVDVSGKSKGGQADENKKMNDFLRGKN